MQATSIRLFTFGGTSVRFLFHALMMWLLEIGFVVASEGFEIRGSRDSRVHLGGFQKGFRWGLAFQQRCHACLLFPCVATGILKGFEASKEALQ